MDVLQFEVCFRSLSSVTKRRAGELATERYSRRLAAMDDRAETQRIEERLPQGTDEWLARPRLSTTSRGTITPVVILQPLSAPVGDVVMYTGPLQPMGQLHGIGREFGVGTQLYLGCPQDPKKKGNKKLATPDRSTSCWRVETLRV